MTMAVFWVAMPCSLVEVDRVSPDHDPIPTGPVKVSALAVWFLYLKPIPRARLTHRPDDGGTKDL
jgi:hypothetical protein